MKRCYQLENCKVVTLIFKQQQRHDLKTKLGNLISELTEYSRKFSKKTLRLCFSTEQELFSICSKIFSQDLIMKDPLTRKVISIYCRFCQISGSAVRSTT